MDLDSYLQFVFALIFVLGLIVLLMVVIKRTGFMPAGVVRKAGARRLKVIESLPVDAKHRLVLVQRDDQEHLILLGVNADLLIESGLTTPSTQDFAQMVEAVNEKEAAS